MVRAGVRRQPLEEPQRLGPELFGMWRRQVAEFGRKIGERRRAPPVADTDVGVSGEAGLEDRVQGMDDRFQRFGLVVRFATPPGAAVASA